MKYSVALVAATLAASVSAQIGNIPQCALQCALNSIGSTGCQTTDIACVCKATGFITALTPCVQKACSAAELGQTITAAEGLCAQFGVSLSIPTGTPAPSTSSAPATTSVVSTESTTMSMTTSVTVVVPTITANTTTTMMPPTPSSNATTAIPTTALPTASPSGNAASSNHVAVGGIAAILAFAAALL